MMDAETMRQINITGYIYIQPTSLRGGIVGYLQNVLPINQGLH
jgi:hypothetical protein